MPDRSFSRTGLPMVDLFFNGFTMMLDAQRNVFSSGLLVPLAPMNSGSAQQDRAFEIGATEQEVIPITKEELRIGKRQVQSAKAYRISATVVEVPVEQQVNLRAETVAIERRPATGTTVRGGQSFENRTIEVHEVYEEPVVSKVVTQAEEVVIYKTLSERTATVRETVRETHVEVEEQKAQARPRAEITAALEADFRAAAGDKPRRADRGSEQVERKDHNDNDEQTSGELKRDRRRQD